MKKNNITYAESIRSSIDINMSKNKNLILFGEGIDDPSSMFGTTKGLAKKHGIHRVVEMPISENCLIGAAIGSSMLGDTVIVNLQRVEFALLALEQIINNAAKAHYISQGKHKISIILRMIIGRGWGQGPEHSQSFETLFSSIPGLKVMMPVFPNEAYQLMNRAIKDNNPTIFLEQRWCHYGVGNYDKKVIDDGDSFTKLSSGSMLTLVSMGYASIEALQVVNFLRSYKINIELFNLKIMRPLKINKIINSVKKTKKIITIDNGPVTLGLGSEIISQLVEKSILFKEPPTRLGLPDHLVPSSRSFIDEVYVTPTKIIQSVLKTLKIDKKTSKDIIKKYISNLKKLPKDIPHPDFKGPF